MADHPHPNAQAGGGGGEEGPGGFLPPQQTILPSPAPSASPSTTTSISGLPRPRSHPLRPGSAKEEKIRSYVDGQLMYVQRRYVKKFQPRKPGDDVAGYRSAGELCRDVDALLNIIWLSGTPALQIPYLLNIANEFTEWVTKFPPQAGPLFSTLRRLDHCFASLLAGQDAETGDALPGFGEDGGGVRGVVTRTDMVRCRSIVEQTRVVVTEVMTRQPQGEGEGEGNDEDEGEEESDDDDTEQEITELESEAEAEAEPDATGSGFAGPDDDDDDDDDDMYMDVARVYERTLVQLGEVLDQTPFSS